MSVHIFRSSALNRIVSPHNNDQPDCYSKRRQNIVMVLRPNETNREERKERERKERERKERERKKERKRREREGENEGDDGSSSVIKRNIISC